MQLNEIFALETVVTGLSAPSKTLVLRALSDKLGAIHGIQATTVFDCLSGRERLGSTAIGGGVAIPHAKIEGLDRLVGGIACLEAPIEFEAIDDRPVDLVFVLLAPESAGSDHLRVLAQLSRLARDPQRCEALRRCETAEDAWAMLTTHVDVSAAAA